MFLRTVVSVGSVLLGCGGASSSQLLNPFDGEGGGGSDASSEGAAAVHGGADLGVKCGPGTPCTVPAEVCCRYGNGAVDACLPTLLCLGGLSIPCDDSSDCAAAGHPGQVCCLMANAQGGPTSVQCEDPSACGGTQLCNVATGDACPNNTSCRPGQQALQGYDTCR